MCLTKSVQHSVKLTCLWVSPQTRIMVKVLLRFIKLFTGICSFHKNQKHCLLSLSRTTGTPLLHDIFIANSLQQQFLNVSNLQGLQEILGTYIHAKHIQKNFLATYNTLTSVLFQPQVLYYLQYCTSFNLPLAILLKTISPTVQMLSHGFVLSAVCTHFAIFGVSFTISYSTKYSIIYV